MNLTSDNNTLPTQSPKMKIMVNGIDPWRVAWLVELLSSVSGYQVCPQAPAGVNPEDFQSIQPGQVFPAYQKFSDTLLRHAEANNIKILYLYCDVRDAIASDYYQLRYLNPSEAERVYPAIQNFNFDQACEPDHLAKWCRAAQLYDDVGNWLNHPNVVAFSYEQMKYNMNQEVAWLLRELSINVSAQEIVEICQNNSFEDQWTNELQQKAAEDMPPRGTVGIWMNRLKLETLKSLSAQFGDLLIQYGYETDKNWTIHYRPEESTDWIGWLDRFSGSKVVGWAQKLSSDDPVEVILYINDQEIMRAVADKFRQDLLDANIHPEGKCAFVFHIENVVQLNPYDTIRVRPAGADEDLPKAREIPEVVYADWVQKYYPLNASDRNAIREHIDGFQYQPQISIVIPVYNTPVPILRAALDSVRKQMYTNWELCIADDASPDPEIRKVLEEYQQADSRIQVTYRTVNGHICEASNTALELASGDFITFLDHDDELTEDALYHVVHELNVNSDLDIIYSDEDKIDSEGVLCNPNFKPDFSPDYFLGTNYLCHLTTIRSSLIRKVSGFRKGFEGAQDYDLFLRCYRETSAEKIRHIPWVLYHWRMMEGSTAHSQGAKPYAVEKGQTALEDYFQSIGQAVKVTPVDNHTMYRLHYPLPDQKPLVSIIIPTRNLKEDLEVCINSILQKTDYPNYEILVVNNQSDQADCLQYLDSLKAENIANVIEYDHPFNFPALNNFAAGKTEGELLCFLNNDTEVTHPEWLTEMVSHALRPEIGAVGAKLLYRNGTIQHAGVVTGIGGFAAHPSKHAPGTSPGLAGRLWLLQNSTCVTAACMLVRRNVFNQVQGFDENLTIALNDVDFCLQVQEAGYRNLWTPQAILYHYESKSRGFEDTPEKNDRLKSEMEYIQKRWGEQLFYDPNYNPNYSLFSEQWELACPPRTKPPWMDFKKPESDPSISQQPKDLDFMINKGFAFLDKSRVQALKGLEKTIIVVGVARSGTSVLSGVLHHLGVFMGDKAVEPVYEDVRLAGAFESNQLDEAKTIIQEYNEHHSTWGLKRPGSLIYLEPLLKLTRNPVCLFVFRDIFAIANRNRISAGVDIVRGLEMALNHYRQMVDFLKTQNPCAVMFSYEKAFEFKEEWVNLLVESLGIPATAQQKKEALDFITRNSEDYLKNTRPVKILGYVEEINPTRILGWARNLESYDPAEVILYVNNKRTLSVQADKPHQELSLNQTKSNCNVAFEFNVEGVVDLKPDDVIQVRALGDMEFLPQVADANKISGP